MSRKRGKRTGPTRARARRAMKQFRASLKALDQSQTPTRKHSRSVNAVYVVRSDSIVKLGVTGNLESRLNQHRRQGLWKVVYVLHSPDSNSLKAIERTWKQFVKQNSHLRITREVLPDGYTEATPLTDEVKIFVDSLLKAKHGDNSEERAE